MTQTRLPVVVLVCGGRDYRDYATVERELDALQPTKVVTGEAAGADQLAYQWAVARAVEYEGYPAQWENYGAHAGPMRNRQMLLAEKPDLVLAFPGGRGTANMVALAEAAGCPVRRVAADPNFIQPPPAPERRGL